MHTEGRMARMAAAVLLAGLLLHAGPALAADTAHEMYTRALARERNVRDASKGPTLAELRAVVRQYEALVRRYPRSGYCDNALWQAANVAALAFGRFRQTADKRAAIRLLDHLKAEYPSSSLAARAEQTLDDLASPPPDATPVAYTTAAAVAPAAEARSRKIPAPVVIRDITRTALPEAVRVSIEMDAESFYRHETLENPRRVFFDIKGTRAAAALERAKLQFADDVVREIRLGRHPDSTTRVVMDMEGVDSYSVFTLYNPFRVVVDFRRRAPLPSTPIEEVAAVVPVRTPPRADPPAALVVPEVKIEPKLTLPAPGGPAVNSNGQFSIARQLGLGVSRIVIDAGHGGHDPGARANGLNEAELVLDVAVRLQKLLERQPGIDVTMTRDTDVFIPLEERTAIANRQGADLFLSIHANASRNSRARGVETYFLNFASNPEAEAVAARENAASGRTMHSLPEIVRAIALNNKLDESRDFADMVQKALVKRLAPRNKELRDLGVKQAPFVVLIGAGMPSVLAEISFVTNRQEGQLLKSAAYRQHIAEALQDAIVRYQKSLKKMNTVARK